MVRPVSQAARERQIAATLRYVERRFGAGVVRRLGEVRPRRDERAVPSGSLGLDLATGLGGLPRGHLAELIGVDSSGKTALLHGALAATQRAGGLAALIDAEGSADGEALFACGVDLDALLVFQPTSAADALLLLTILARCGGLDALGLHSVAALRDLPLTAAPDGADPARWGLDLARFLARALRVLTAALRDSPTAVVVTNEPLPPPPPQRSVGGRALAHFAALRVAVAPLALLPDAGGETRALRVGLTVVKHKLGAPGGRAEVEVRADGGVDRPAELLALGLDMGLVARHPAGLVFGDDVLGRAEAAARRRLAVETGVADALAAAIMAARDRPTAA